ncbi:gametocyte-specific factor 1 [Ara ararauna]
MELYGALWEPPAARARFGHVSLQRAPRVPQAELRRHVTACPDRRHEMELPPPQSSQHPEVPWEAPPCQEDWEAELAGLADPEPFILQPCSRELLLPWDSSTPAAPRSQSRGAGPPRGGAGAKRGPGPPQDRGGPPKDGIGGAVVPPPFQRGSSIKSL